MSWSKPIQSNYAEVDAAIESLMAAMDEDYGIPSTVDSMPSTHKQRTSAATNPPKMMPSTTSASKRTSTSAANPSAPKYQKLDDDEAAMFLLERDIETFEEALYAKYTESNHDEGEEEVAIDDAGDATNEEDDDRSNAEVLPLPSCVPCSSTNKRFKSNDSDLKNYAFDMPRMSIGRCSSSECKFGGNCVGKTEIDDMADMVNDFWDESNCAAPSSQSRRLKIITILRAAIRPNENNEFHFYATCRDKNNRCVCEAGFLILLGLSNSSIASKAPGQWRRLKKYVADGRDAAGIEYKSQAEERLLKAENKNIKMKSALTFIEWFSKEFGDTIPGSEGGGQNVFVAPFVDLKSFHEEYCAFHAHRQTPPSDVARMATFCSAFKLLSETKGIKKLRAKGTFNTCEICNNASELLKNKNRKLKQSQREIIQKFRQLHLTQQSREREFLDRRKLEAGKCDDAGNPLRLFLFGDGFTIYSCRTPKFPKDSKGDKHIETRIVGIEVVCGPIKTVLVYRTDELISGGANITIEMTRQALIDVSILLRQRSLLIPRTLWLQFDNCGDNKNKEIFGYYSLLVESFSFDEIEIAFLIVGHTHASIDQYFSVISRAIQKAAFIGTPVALLELIRRCHDESWNQPAIIREIKVYYDMKAMFAPYINKKIKYYNLPHIYKVIPSFGHIAICQYKTDSTSVWKPNQPKEKISDLDTFMSIAGSPSIYIPDLAAVNGETELLTFLGLADSNRPLLAKDLLGKDNDINRLQDVNKILPELEALSLKSLQQQAERMHDESDGIEIKGAYEFRQTVQRTMLNANNKEEGYIIWLDLAPRKNVDLPPIYNVLPPPFDPKLGLEQIEHLDLTVHSEEKEQDQQRDVHPSVKRRGQSSNKNKNLSTEDVLKRQLKAAKNISSTCQWVLEQIQIGRVRTTDSSSFELSHFSGISVTQSELKWLHGHNTIEKVIAEYVIAYEHAPKWEPFPKATLSVEDLKRIEESKKKFAREVAEANKLAQALLVRLGDNAGEKQHIIEYGEDTTGWVAQRLKEKRSSKAKETTKSTTRPQSSSIAVESEFVVVRKCDVEECVEDSITGFCGNNIECDHYRFCSLHLVHSSHSLHKLRTSPVNTQKRNSASSTVGGRGSKRGNGAATTGTTSTLSPPRPAGGTKNTSAIVIVGSTTVASTGGRKNSRNGGNVEKPGAVTTLNSVSNNTSSSTVEPRGSERGGLQGPRSYEDSFSAKSSTVVSANRRPMQDVASSINSRYSRHVQVSVPQANQQEAEIVESASADQNNEEPPREQAIAPSARKESSEQLIGEQTIEEPPPANYGKPSSSLKELSIHPTIESIGKAAVDLHTRIFTVVEAEERKSKHKDVPGRLLRELEEFPSYATPLAILSTEIYKLELPQLMTTEALEYTSTTTVTSRDYKHFTSSKKGGFKAFVRSFVDAFVKNY